MNKIPVWRTVAQSYGFAFGRYFSILGALWLPLVVTGVAFYFLMMPLFAHIEDFTTPQRIMEHASDFRGVFLGELIGILALVMISSGITKEALGIRRGPKFFYLAFGGDEFRVLVGYIALFLLWIVFAIVFGIVAALVGGAAYGAMSVAGSTQSAPGMGILVFLLLRLIANLVLLYVFVRLTFLFLPATVAEKKIGILRGWELTGGNFWRIFLIGLLVLGPMILIIAACEFALLGPMFMELARDPQIKDPAIVMHRVGDVLRSFVPYLPYLAVAALLIYPIFYGLLLGPAAFAYRALMPLPVEPASVPEPESKPVEDSGLPEEVQEVIGPEKLEEH